MSAAVGEIKKLNDQLSQLRQENINLKVSVEVNVVMVVMVVMVMVVMVIVVMVVMVMVVMVLVRMVMVVMVITTCAHIGSSSPKQSLPPGNKNQNEVLL